MRLPFGEYAKVGASKEMGINHHLNSPSLCCCLCKKCAGREKLHFLATRHLACPGTTYPADILDGVVDSRATADKPYHTMLCAKHGF